MDGSPAGRHELSESCRLLFDYIRDPVLLVSSDGIVLDCNRTAFDVYGWGRDELIGRPMSEVRAEGAPTLPEAAARAADPASVLFETVHRKADGSTFPVEVGARELELEDGTLAHLAVVRDLTERERARAEIASAQAQIEQVFETAANGMRIIDAEFTVTRVNSAFSQMCGVPAERAVGGKCYEVFPGAACDSTECPLRVVLGGAERFETEVVKARPDDGSRIICALTVQPIREGERVVGIVEDFRDVTASKRYEQDIAGARDFYLKLLEDFPTLVWRSDVTGRRDYVNRAFLEFTGRPASELLGDGWMRFVHPGDLDRVGGIIRDARTAREPYRFEFRLRRADGQWRWIDETGSPFEDLDGVHAGYVGTGQDITEQREAREAVLHMAYHDTLTGLPNRALLLDRLGLALANAEREHSPVGIIFFDVDRFKGINDSHGHETGDRVLRAVAERAVPLLRKGDTLARFGGDEFVALLPRVSAVSDVELVAGKLLEAVAGPLEIDGDRLEITLSLGVAVAGPGEGADHLLARADRAMYRSKAEGGAAVSVAP